MIAPGRPRILTEKHRQVLDVLQSMTCDHASGALEIGRCQDIVTWGLRIMVPSKTQLAPGHHHVPVTTTLNVCETHHGEFSLDHLLTDQVKHAAETMAKKNRPMDFRCDFDAAHLVYVAVYAPQYIEFLWQLKFSRAPILETLGETVAH